MANVKSCAMGMLLLALVCQAQVTFTSYPVPSGFPRMITSGPDGNLWFTEFNGNNVGRITTAGLVTEFPIPTVISQPVGITAGPDGNLWFTEANGNNIGRITTAGVITEFPIPTAASGPNLITTGPDGNLWFTETSDNANNIGRITTAGVITEFPIPTAASRPVGITAGADGNLWFTEWLANKIGNITANGVITEFSLQNDPTLASKFPNEITTGPDGNLWFTELLGGNIGRITTTGEIAEFPMSPNDVTLEGITPGPDGNLWFIEQNADKLGRISTGGLITEFPIPVDPETGANNPWGITAGSDHNLWFVLANGDTIVKASVPPADSTPPVIVPIVTGTAGANGWYISAVSVSWSVSDPESGIFSSSGCGVVALVAPTTGTTLTCSAINGSALPGSMSVTIMIDLRGPAISATINGQQGAGGIYTSNVTVTWIVKEFYSNVVSTTGCSPTTLTDNTSGTILTCSATNGAGLSNSVSVRIRINKSAAPNTPTGTNVVVQPIDPTTGGAPVTLTFSTVSQAGTTTVTTSSSGPSPPAGFALGTPPVYYNLATTAAFTGGISVCINYTGIIFTNPPDILHFAGSGWMDVTTSQDTAHNVVCGNVTSLSPFGLFRRVDTTPPVVVPSITGALGTNGWYIGNVAVSWSVTDQESGIASSTGCGPVTLAANTPGTTLTCSATNGAGLSASVPVTIKIDTMTPVISGMPVAGCSLWPPNGKMVQVAIVTAADALSGLAPGSFQVTGTSNEPPSSPEISITPNGTGGYIVQLQADRLGNGSGRVYTLTATVSDLAGNTARLTTTCSVPHDQGN